MFYIPLTTNPVGWLILGASGYMLYKAGKKKGEEEAAASRIKEIPMTNNEQKTTQTNEKGAQ